MMQTVETDLKIYVSYSTIAVFDHALDQPFNDWQEQHISQGFSWRPGSVSFMTFEESGICNVSLEISEKIRLRSHTERAILVPFTYPSCGQIEVASISDGQAFECPQQTLGILYEAGRPDTAEMWCRVTFITGGFPEAQVIVADSKLSPELPLLMEAAPA